MTYIFTCPHCQTKTRVEAHYSGQSGQCVTCGQRITIPDFASAVTDAKSAGSRGRASRSSASRRSAVWFAAAAVIVVMAFSLVFVGVRFGGETISQMQEVRLRRASIKNLETIASALRAYASDHGRLPPPNTVDASGNRLHSWRVLILPYLGEDDLYDQVNLDLPWDHPENSRLRFEMPPVYRHPNAARSPTGDVAAYYLITGTGTLFPPGGPLGVDRITDEAAKTLLVVEGSPLAATSWAEPIDLDFAGMQGRINGGSGAEPGGWLDDGAALATADGRGHFAAETLPPRTFRSLVTPAGGEPLPDDVLD